MNKNKEDLVFEDATISFESGNAAHAHYDKLKNADNRKKSDNAGCNTIARADKLSYRFSV